MTADARLRFLEQLRRALDDGTLVKLTLGKHRGADPTLQNLFVRPVKLKAGPHFAFVWRHDTRDVTKNHGATDAFARLGALVGGDFLDAHLFTPTATLQLECQPDGSARLRTKQAVAGAAAAADHDRAKTHLIPADSPWLRALGVTNDRGQPREGMADKFRQIQKFAELLSHLVTESALPSDRPLTVVDMGSGKGYLTFAVATLLGERARVQGVEARAELVDLCNRVARDHGLASSLAFAAGTIADTPLNQVDVLIALHACDTATDDALAKGIAAQAALLVVSPCCQKELRPQLRPPPVLAEALRHGIFQERQAEFVTDALRAELLEWAGYRTKVFEFISTEHTAKNLMIAAVKARPAGDVARADRLRQLAAFYGIRHHQLATHLGVSLIE
ncbi:MAG: SAM-dependent methyltransferase [Verrucomicrobia bacterium]|nr:SAM-dependent methyltransferase [Verrucomicrobiota bacterium]